MADFENDDDVQTTTIQVLESDPNSSPADIPVYKNLTVQLPLKHSSNYTQYSMINNFNKKIVQDFKMLLLTNPGEKIMDSNYGIGAMYYLYERSENTKILLADKIEEQVAEYLPSIQIDSINFIETPDSNALTVKIGFTVPVINYTTYIEVVGQSL